MRATHREKLMADDQVVQLPPRYCPHCGHRSDAATPCDPGEAKAIGEARPGPGAILICFQCGGVAEIQPDETLAAFDLERIKDPETRAKILLYSERARMFAAGRAAERARREDLLAEAKAKRARVVDVFGESYVAACERLDALLAETLARGGEPPRFAMPSEEFLVAIHIAPEAVVRMARNEAAREFFTKACALLGCPPTFSMLDAVLENQRVPMERVTLTELGLVEGPLS
jgi:hypothetical protein